MPQKAIQYDNGIRTRPKDFRQSAAARGYDSRWQKYSKAFLKKNPLCAICAKSGIVAIAKVVDHIKPHKGDTKLFWDKSNHQSACIRCHNHKTATEDGGFGNKQRKETSGEKVLRLAMAGVAI